MAKMDRMDKMAKTDKDFRDDEFNFLYAIAQQLGVSDEEFKELHVVDFGVVASEVKAKPSGISEKKKNEPPKLRNNQFCLQFNEFRKRGGEREIQR